MVKKFNYSNIVAKTISCNTINNHIGLKKNCMVNNRKTNKT